MHADKVTVGEWKVKMNNPPQSSYPVGISPQGDDEVLIRTWDPRLWVGAANIIFIIIIFIETSKVSSRSLNY